MRALDVMALRMRGTGLVRPSESTPDAVVRRVLAMQAQDYAPAKWSVGQRARGLTDADVDRAIADGSIVRTHVLRPTWHFVHRDDLRWLQALTGPRVHRRSAPRYAELGLDAGTLRRAERAIASALEGGRHLTRDGIAEVLDKARIDASGQRLPWILSHCELVTLISSGPRVGAHHSYALTDERVPAPRPFDRDEALAELARRYLASHGPASARDLSWWSSLTLADVRHALASLGDHAVAERVDDVELWRIAADTARTPSARGAHLLQAYDELVVGYTESRHLGDPRRDLAQAAWHDRTLPTGTVLVNGELRGRWRRTVGPNRVEIEILLWDEPHAGELRALEAEARRLGRFIGREALLETARL